MAYLFGGRAGATVYGDLWAYDLAADTWSQLAASGPAPRFGHNAAWVEGMGLVIFAGQGESGFFNDLWAFDPATMPGGSCPLRVPSRFRAMAAARRWDPTARLWISHGFTSEGARFSIHARTTSRPRPGPTRRRSVTSPIRRCLHGCWWTNDGMLTLYAGQTDGVTALADEWQLTVGPRPGTNAWQEVARRRRLPPGTCTGPHRWERRHGGGSAARALTRTTWPTPGCSATMGAPSAIDSRRLRAHPRAPGPSSSPTPRGPACSCLAAATPVVTSATSGS